MRNRTLGHQVVDVVRPVLDGGVANACVLLQHNLNHCGVQGVGLVDGGGAALNVVNVGALVSDDQGAFELAHVLGVNAEVRLQRDLHVNSRGNVHEGATGPYGGVQCGELVVTNRDDGAEVFLEQFGVLAQTGIGIDENHALLLQVLTDLVVHDLRLVLCSHTRDEGVTLRLGNTQTLVGGADILGQFLPRSRLTLGRAHEVLDVVEVDFGKIRTPGGHGLTLKELQRLQTHIQHPLGFVLLRRDVAHDVLVQAALCYLACFVGVCPTVLVVANALEFGVHLQDL